MSTHSRYYQQISGGHENLRISYAAPRARVFASVCHVRYLAPCVMERVRAGQVFSDMCITPEDLARVAELARDRDATAHRSKVTATQTPTSHPDTNGASSTPGSLILISSALKDGLKSFIESRSHRLSEELNIGHSDAGVTPLSTPDVSKHGADESWLFLCDSRISRGTTDSGDGSESDCNLHAGDSKSRGGLRRRTVDLRRNCSVTFTDVEVHDIGPLKSLRNEKGLQRKGSFSSLTDTFTANMNALKHKLKKKSEEEKESSRLTKARLKQSRAFMFDNLDHARAFNDDKPAWETRDESLRGGQKLLGLKRSLSMPNMSLANTSLQGCEIEGDGEDYRGVKTSY